MAYVAAPPQTLMGLWRLERHRFRPIGTIVAEARSGKIPGVETDFAGTLIVTNSRAAVAAMSKDAA